MTNIISGTTASLVILSGSADDPTSITASGLLRNGIYAAPYASAWTVTNAGSVLGAGVTLESSGTVLNSGGIDGGGSAILDKGVYLYRGGSVTNQNSGTISGYNAISAYRGATVLNFGNIEGNTTGQDGKGIYLGQGGSVTNERNASITGYSAVVTILIAATVVNAGIILGNSTAAGGSGVNLGDGGGITNLSTGTISGSTGIYGSDGVTVVNAGTISGPTNAIMLAAGFVNRVVFDPGAVFSGTVSGGNAIGAAPVSTLELAAGSPDTLSGLGTQFTDFAQVSVDTGAIWTLLPQDTIRSGVTLTNAGTLLGGVSLAAGAALTNTTTGTVTVPSGVAVFGLTGGAATIVNAGLITNTNASAGAGISLPAGGIVTNQSGGTISGFGGIRNTGGTPTVVNTGSITGSETSSSGRGIYLYAGGSVTNNSGGTISAYHAIYSDSTTEALTVVNAGSIAGNPTRGTGRGIQVFGNGVVTNLSGGFVSGYNGIYADLKAFTVVNAGSISGDTSSMLGTAVELFAGGSVSNLSTGVITGYDALLLVGAAAVNAGRLLGSTAGESGAGIKLGTNGGSVTNQSGGIISGYFGVISTDGATTVVNSGSIAGTTATFLGAGVRLDVGGSVTNLSGGSIGGYDGIVSDTAITVVNVGNITGSTTASGAKGIVFDAGGSVTNQSGGTISGFDGIKSIGALTVVNAGSIAGTSFAVQFPTGDVNRLVVDPGAYFSGAVTGGNAIGATTVSTLELAGSSLGTLSGIGTQIIDFGNVSIDAGASWLLTGNNTLVSGTTLNGTGGITLGTGGTLELLGSVVSGGTIGFASSSGELQVIPGSFYDQINNFKPGNTIQLTGVLDGTSVTLTNSNTLEVDRSSHSPIDLTLDPTRSYTGQLFAISGTGAVTETTPCFLRGTMIRTRDGETRVEDLRVGDPVITLSGAIRPITWIGTGQVLVSPGRRSAATPVVIRKGALADNIPYDDMRITKGHALFVDGVLIPAEFLINHRSIHWDDHKREVEFYHIELETHDVLIANGAPSESYRDDGNRWLFRNGNSGWDQPAKAPCAPVVTGGAIVDAIWHRLLDRAGPRPGVALTDDADLHLLVNGTRLDATTRTDDVAIFRVLDAPTNVRIISRAAVPQELGLARDPRCLGVALRRIVVRRKTQFRLIEANDERLADGFHDVEADNGLRWTDGDAALPATLLAGFDGAVELVLHLGGSTRYPAFASAAARPAA